MWEDSEGVRPLTFHPLLAETAARLLGVGAVRLWHDQALYKEPGGRETDPHQDQPYWPIVETNTITAWIPFDGSTLETGAMGYLPGSHRLGLREFVNIFTGEAGGGADGVLGREELAGIEPVFVEVPAGAVAFHHGLTFHLAGANRSGAVRRVHTVIYFADGVDPWGRPVPASVGGAGRDRDGRGHRLGRDPLGVAATCGVASATGAGVAAAVSGRQCSDLVWGRGLLARWRGDVYRCVHMSGDRPGGRGQVRC